MDTEEQRQFDAMAEIASRDADADLDARIQKHVKADRRDRMIRRTCRWIVMAMTALMAGILYTGSDLGGYAGAIICVGSFVVLTAATVLFFKGGLAPGRTRLLLTAEERKRLDN
jgi:hypothetical protein